MWLSEGPLAAQAPAKPAAARPAAAKAAPPRKGSTLPRTADGHPDLQGMYDVATMTPVDRPAGVSSLVLSKEEAAALELYETERQKVNDAPLSGDRGAPPVGGETTTGKSYLELLERFGGGVVGGYNNFWLAGGTQLITVDGQKRSSLVMDPPDGKVPAMKAEARKRNAAFTAGGAVSPDAGESAAAGPPGAFDGPELRPLSERCLLGFGNTSGPPTLPNYFYNNLKQIVQTKDTVILLNEMVHDARVVRMNAEHVPPTIRKWMGDSVGHWDGDTLVVDTTNFTTKTRYNGSGDQLHVVEALHAHRREDDPLPLHRRGSDDVGSVVDRRVSVADDRREALRVRVPRGQLLARRHAARRASEGSRRRGGEDQRETVAQRLSVPRYAPA